MTDTPRPEKKTIRLEDFPKKLLRSFMPAAYPELASEEASASALYLAGVAFLVVLLLVPVLYTMHKRLYERQITATRTYVERAFPEDLYFENGEAHYDGEQPYVHVEEEGNQRYAVIIDTTGQTSAIPDEYDEGMLMTKTTIIHKVRADNDRTETPENPIPSTPGRVSARQFYVETLAKRKWPDFAIAVGLFFLAYTAVPLFALATLAAAVTFALTALGKAKGLPFRTCFSIAAHAATPVAFTAASMLFVRTRLEYYLLLGVPLLLFMLFAAFGARACRRAQEAT